MIDIAIIGGGPAGLSAGLYGARGGSSTVLFEEVFVGGQAAKTDKIDNYPGFEGGIEGSALGMRMEQQASRFGLSIRYEPVESVSLAGDVKRIHTAKGVLQAKTIILATGASPRKLGLPNEDALTGAGVSYCATCDGAFFKNRDVAVVGGGDTALSDALYLSRFAKSVHLIHRRDALRGSMALQKAVLAEKNVTIVWNSIVEALHGERALSGLTLTNVVTGASTHADVAALFVAVGVVPRTGLVEGQLTLDENGYILTDAYMRTSLAGVYAAGDARQTPLRQVVTAVADGAVAATDAMAYLATQAQAVVS